MTSVDEEAKQVILLEIFRPYFERLIEVLISKGQLPESESMFTSEDKEAFRCYRVDITDTMVSIVDERKREKCIVDSSRCVCITPLATERWKVREECVDLK